MSVIYFFGVWFISNGPYGSLRRKEKQEETKKNKQTNKQRKRVREKAKKKGERIQKIK